jgi:transposase
MNPPSTADGSSDEIAQLRHALAEAQAKVEAFKCEQQNWEQERRGLEEEQRKLLQEQENLKQQQQALEQQQRVLEQQRQHLEHQLMLLRRCLFGSRSEKVSAEELEARIAQHAREAGEEVAKCKRPDEPPAEAEEEKPEAASKPEKRKARPHGRNPLPDHLPRRRIEHPIDPARNTCPHCPDHPQLVRIGEDIREKLHKLPVQYEVHQHVYPKSACPRCHNGVVMPEGPDNGLKADITVVADVAVQKYGEHKPLYRQQQAFERLGIPLRRQTLCDWTGWISDEVTPVVRAMAEHILSQRCVQSDETPVRMQMPDGKMHVARLWGYCLPWAEVVFDFRTNKSHHGPEEFLKGGRALYLQADGGSSYEPVLSHLKLEHIACMAHIRRKIFEAREDAPVACDRLLASIQQLYRIEREAKDNKLELAGLLDLRQREARPVFENLGEMIKLFAEMRPPKTPFGRAMAYAKNQWAAMARYLEVPEAELDNNSMEHAMRAVVMGRRNWLHVGQEVGGERAANLFSLMVSCRRLGVEPYGYLCDIVPRLGRHPQKDIWELTPRGWRDARAKAAGPMNAPH